jgi:hypothetical protein
VILCRSPLKVKQDGVKWNESISIREMNCARAILFFSGWIRDQAAQ